MSERVEVTVGADGSVTVEAHGVKGSGCKALTEAIERAIGTTTADTKKPEFMQQAPAVAGRTQKAGW